MLVNNFTHGNGTCTHNQLNDNVPLISNVLTVDGNKSEYGSDCRDVPSN